MSYQKHNFTPGAVLLASQLNDMDNEIEALSQGETVLSDDFKEALLNCFENVAWINKNGQTYYGTLYNSLYPDNMWFITNILTDCITSNNATNILKNNSYVATITANEGYTLDGATVSITMGGNDVTNLYYSSGSINIPNVTGDLVITVSAVSAVTSINAVFTQGSAVIYDTDSLDTLRQYLVVTVTYSDSTTAAVSDYTLTGTLAAGTSTITVSYGGKTATFSVIVTSTSMVEINGVTYDISIADGSNYKLILTINSTLYLYWSSSPFYLQEITGGYRLVNIYGNAYRGVQNETTFESQGLLSMHGINSTRPVSEVGEIGRESTTRTLSQYKWTTTNLCKYDNGYTDIVVLYKGVNNNGV